MTHTQWETGMPQVKKILMRTAVATAALAASGCETGLKSTLTTPDQVGNGLIYYLPTSELITKIDYQLIECGANGPKIDVAAISLASVTVPEKSLPLLIEQAAMSSWLKTIENLSIEINPNGLLQSINYKAADHTGDAIVGAAKLVSSIAGAGIVPLAAANCSAAAQSALNGKASAQSAVGQRWAALQAAEAKLAGQDSPANRSERDLASRYYDAARTTLTSAKSALVLTETIVCRSGDTKPDLTCEPWKKQIAQWFSNPADPSIDSYKPEIAFPKALVAREPLKSAVESAAKKGKYVFYRTTAPIEVTVKPGNATGAEKFVLDVFQAGQVATLEVTNSPFQSNAFAAEFTEAGLLKKFTYSDTASRAKVLLDSLNEARKGAADVQLEDLDRQINREKKRKELIDAEKARRAAEAP
jgi:hypothetical protein